MSPRLFLPVLLIGLMPSTHGAESSPPAKYRSAGDIIEAAPPTAWRLPDPERLLYMELPQGRVIIELAPQFAPEHVANIIKLARGHFWDNTSIYRAQDNFVVQFGDADGDDPAKAKSLGDAKTHLPAEFHRPAAGLNFTPLPDRDGWAPEVGFVDGFPAARDPKSGLAWPVHCYGTVGAARGNNEDSSTGAELYVAIGQSPRQLDDNLTVVGKVLVGMELLATTRRSAAPAGIYENPAERTPIKSIRLASDVPKEQRTRMIVLRTDTDVFRDATGARRNRIDDFYKRSTGHIDICNVPVAVEVAE
jgi:peptidylprolyl isomerase